MRPKETTVLNGLRMPSQCANKICGRLSSWWASQAVY